MTVARPVQGHPVLAQAGQSGPGMNLASRIGEAVFTLQRTKEDARRFYTDIKDMAEQHGRRRSDVLVMPGIVPVVGATRSEAEDRFADLQSLVSTETGLAVLSQMLGADLAGYDLDGPVPEDLPEHEGFKSRREVLLATAKREQLTLRQLYLSNAPARGHRVLVGSSVEIADMLQDWFEDGAADGFMLLPTHLPGGLDAFSELVVPELQRRGIFRTEYEGATLREHLGLPRPPHPGARSA